ncbi:MAG: N-acetylmuramoyl-L-alanine amidase [Paludibacteraceae bacterium]
MRKTIKYSHLFFNSFVFLLLFIAQSAFAKPFTIVIDAGHGGHDTGAVGKYSKEKNLNLSVSLLFGKMVEENQPDVKVIYTRKTDVFLTLQERADIVNRNNADAFFCIHTNANNNSAAHGTETYTLRVNSSRTQGNLEVAMRENSVMLLEEDYKTRYQGFDPRSVDSYIMFDFMQDKYIDKSIQLASLIQRQFVRLGRFDRGVQQAGFWVLYKSACPSVLIEMGFISNKIEENYLNSQEGQSEIATSIYRAFLTYKKDHDKKTGKATSSKDASYSRNNADETNDDVKADTMVEIPQNKNISNVKIQPKESRTETPVENKDKVIYKVQILATKEKLGEKDDELKGLTDVDYYYEGGLHKYTYGNCSTMQEALRLRKSIIKKFPYAFVVAFKNGKKMDVK